MSLSLTRLIVRSVPSMVARTTYRPSCNFTLTRTTPTLTQSFHSSTYHAAAGPSNPTGAPVKYSTKIAGLDVVPNGVEVFIGLQQEILASIAQYNKDLGFEPACNDYARRLAQHRLKIALEDADDVASIERRLWSGQIEELIEQAENELDCVVLMNEEIKPWEKPNPDELAQFERLASPNFGQNPEQWKTGKPPVITKEEQAQVDAFWAPIDAEIKADQEREAEERRLRKLRK